MHSWFKEKEEGFQWGGKWKKREQWAEINCKCMMIQCWEEQFDHWVPHKVKDERLRFHGKQASSKEEKYSSIVLPLNSYLRFLTLPSAMYNLITTYHWKYKEISCNVINSAEVAYYGWFRCPRTSKMGRWVQDGRVHREKKEHL